MNINDQIKNKLAEQDKLAQNFWNLLEYLWNTKLTTAAPFTCKIWMKCVSVAQLADSHYNIKKTGPFFFKFRKQINNDNIIWISDYNFETQMEDWRELFNKFGTKLTGIIENKLLEIRSFLKLTINNYMYDQKKRESIIKLCKTFLKWYCDYSILDKEIKELKNK